MCHLLPLVFCLLTVGYYYTSYLHCTDILVHIILVSSIHSIHNTCHSIAFQHIHSNLDLIWPWIWPQPARIGAIWPQHPGGVFHVQIQPAFPWGNKNHDQKTPSTVYYTCHSFHFLPAESTSLVFTNLQLIAIPACFFSALPCARCARLLLLLLLFVSGLFFDPFLFFPLLSGFESTISVFNWLKCIESNKQL